MEFDFYLSDVFPTEISMVGSDLIPKGSPGVAKFGPQVVKQRISQIMDVVGKASAEAQSLHQVITSTEKLRTNDDQSVYVLADFSTNQIVGILKIGRKRLFVFDQQGVQHELNPICILDFYVHESRQRLGCGKALFNAMLANEGVDVKHLAIDRPSDKLLNFLRKHYQLSKMIPQVNNFAIFDGFFSQRSDYGGKKAKWSGLDQPVDSPPRHAPLHKMEFQDSRTYNKEPPLHLRNLQSGLPGYVPQRHASSIGSVIHPSHATNGVSNPNAHSYTNGSTATQKYMEFDTYGDLRGPRRNLYDLKYYRTHLW